MIPGKHTHVMLLIYKSSLWFSRPILLLHFLFWDTMRYLPHLHTRQAVQKKECFECFLLNLKFIVWMFIQWDIADDPECKIANSDSGKKKPNRKSQKHLKKYAFRASFSAPTCGNRGEDRKTRRIRERKEVMALPSQYTVILGCAVSFCSPVNSCHLLQHLYKSGFFFIGNTFYNDMTDPSCRDYSQ